MFKKCRNCTAVIVKLHSYRTRTGSDDAEGAMDGVQEIMEETLMSMVWNKAVKMANGLVLGLAALGLTGTAALADEVVLYSSNQPELLDVIA